MHALLGLQHVTIVWCSSHPLRGISSRTGGSRKAAGGGGGPWVHYILGLIFSIFTDCLYSLLSQESHNPKICRKNELPTTFNAPLAPRSGALGVC